jgi:hypothetical protein
MSSSILILPINDGEPDLNVYKPLRQTRRFKYYTIINDPNTMEVDQFQNAPDNELEAFENSFANMGIKGGKRKTKRRKSRKSRKSRRYKK